MIVIFGRLDDASTAFVAEWLHAFGKEYIILNTDDDRAKFITYDMQQKELIFEKEGVVFNLLDIKAAWIRRTGISEKSFGTSGREHKIFFEETDFVQKHIKMEADILVDYLHDIISRECNTILGSNKYGTVNKLTVLDIAKSCGLHVPDSFIVTSKEQVSDLLQRGYKLITKSIGQGVYRIRDEVAYYSYVEEIDDQNLAPQSSHFFPSWMQKKIEKKYELRVFYLLGECYSMAIFSQESEFTAVDFRKYTPDAPNRHVPFVLPKEVSDKIDMLMKKLYLNTGSLDIVVDLHDNYVFLEVNPVGQFAMTSYPCNYYLEKRVAEYLCREN